MNNHAVHSKYQKITRLKNKRILVRVIAKYRKNKDVEIKMEVDEQIEIDEKMEVDEQIEIDEKMEVDDQIEIDEKMDVDN